MAAAGDDEPMRDAAPPATAQLPTPAPPPTAKPKRRFAPQLVEETTKSSSTSSSSVSSNSNKRGQLATSSGTSSTSTADSTRKTTRDASVQVPDVEMSDAPPPPKPKPVRRFAPVPIETTFDSYRVSSNNNQNSKNPHGPTAELTPDPSPTTPHPSQPVLPPPSSTQQQQQEKTAATPEKKAKPRRRFAPQLIETTTRTKKAGQEGPATKPTDKTDITPGTNHIYAPKPKRKPAATPRSPRSNNAIDKGGDDQKEKENSGSPRFLTPRRQQSMKPHLNTRRPTREKSYHPELDTILSSESGNSSEENDDGPAPALNIGAPALPEPTTKDEEGDSWNSRNYDLRNRRESCDEEFSGYLLAVAAREAHRQRELEQAMSAFPNGVRPENVEHFLDRDNSGDDSVADDEALRHGPSQLVRRKSTDPGWAVKEMRAHAEKLAKQSERQPSVDDQGDQEPEIAPPPPDPLWTTTRRRASRDSDMSSAGSPFLSAHSPALLSRLSAVQEKSTPSPSTGMRADPFSMPFASYRPTESEDAQLRKMRLAASPPMLGDDLKFRMCPSPQHTRVDPNHPYSETDKAEEKQRDLSGNSGLWQGYCSNKAKDNATPGLHPLSLLQTPGETVPGTDPFSDAFSVASLGPTGTHTPSSAQQHQNKGGLHMLSGLDERLKREKVRKERQEALLAEFDDAFVTQVYNYISLGYPAMARDFDEELSKISGIAVEELRRDDDRTIGKGFMLQMEMPVNNTGEDDSTGTGNGTPASGYHSGGDDDDVLMEPSEGERVERKRRAGGKQKPPRWRALRLYIREWARQHPSLNGADGASLLAWGVRARRGSWAI
ncbi:Uu.00g064970.m01.CDS01 [Anthostomella pinea]|uniref:Uu.00g064970.m01.CDS01 n=1 Tax=Anthostomella pinea TaxID=933095 RepID=A0AAI8VTM8_9PEZI|nr:Uu.00g064970.m01.CDS01 [Anthostomella pinea]